VALEPRVCCLLVASLCVLCVVCVRAPARVYVFMRACGVCVCVRASDNQGKKEREKKGINARYFPLIWQDPAGRPRSRFSCPPPRTPAAARTSWPKAGTSAAYEDNMRFCVLVGFVRVCRSHMRVCTTSEHAHTKYNSLDTYADVATAPHSQTDTPDRHAGIKEGVCCLGGVGWVVVRAQFAATACVCVRVRSLLYTPKHPL
jgi:hypothetical protein